MPETGFPDGPGSEHPHDGGSADARILSLVYEKTSDAVSLLRVDPDGAIRYVSVNESFLRVFGFRREQVIEAPLERVVPAANMPILRSRIEEAIASRRQLVAEGVTNVPAGTRHGEITLIPIFEGSGPVTHLLCTVKDITARKAAELERERLLRNATFLADATRLLASLDIDQALSDLARLSVPSLGDACAIDLFGEEGPRRLVAVSSDPKRPMRAAVHPTVLAGNALIYQVAEVSLLGIPLRIDGRAVGAITLASWERKYAANDFELVDELARRASLAMDNAGLYRQAREALRARDEFLSIAAHEIRGPVTSIHLAAQGVLQHRVPPDGLQRSLEVIEREDRRLGRFADELLDFGTIRTGRLQFELEEVDLTEVVAQASRTLASDLERSGSTLTVSAPGHVKGRWDRARLEKVVINLLSNAIKFGRGQPIEITLLARDGRAVLAVRDRGIGIAPEARERIFEPFERGVSTRNYGGLGLGLHIVKTIVVALGGTVAVESEVGAGSTFVVGLPQEPGNARPRR